MKKHAKHLFFDMDDTVTPSRTKMDDDMYALFQILPHDVIIVSGAHINQIREQVRDLPFYLLGQNGNQARNPFKEFLWEEKLNEEHTKLVTDHIEQLKALSDLEVRNVADLVEHRGAQISFSLIGHNEDLVRKKACDPDQEIRKRLLATIPFETDSVEVKIGGTTCLDYFIKGRNKGYNVAKLIEHQGWNKEECLYFGDSLFPGGNDETVIGVIDTIDVNDHRHTYEILKTHFA